MSVKKQLLIAAAGFGAIFISMFGKGFAPGSILYGSDAVNIYLPLWIYAKNLFMSGELPLWIPNIFAGMPLLSSSSLIFFYPTELLFMLLRVPENLIYIPDIFIHMLAAAAGTFLFLRRRGASAEASLFGAFTLMLSGYIITYIFVGHWNNIKAGALIPFVFYFTDRAARDRSAFHALNAALILGLQVLATGMQIMAYTYMGAAAYALFIIFTSGEMKAQRLKPVLFIAAATLFILFFSGPQFFPSLDYKDHSWRGDFSYADFVSWSILPAESIAFVLPHFFGLKGGTYFGGMPFNLTSYYMGILPFLLLFFIPFKTRKKEVIFYLAASGIFLALAWGGFTPLYKIFYHIPVFNQFRNPSRFLYLFSFFIAVLAALSLDSVIKDREAAAKRGRGFYIFIGSLLFITAIAGLSYGSLLPQLYSSIKKTAISSGLIPQITKNASADFFVFFGVAGAFCAAFFLFSRKKLGVFGFAALLIFINFLDVNRVNSQFIRIDEYKQHVFKADPAVAAIKSRAPGGRTADFNMLLGPNRGVYGNFDTLNGVHGLQPKHFTELMNNGAFNNLNINRAFNVKTYAFPMDVSLPGFEKIYEEPGRKIYMDTQALGRAYFTGNIIRAGAKNSVSASVAPDFNPLVPVVTGGTASLTTEAEARGSAVIKEYKPGRAVINASADAPGIVVFAEGFFPGWRASVNGLDAEVLRVNHALCGVHVKAGESVIIFEYRERMLLPGFLLFLAAVMVWVVLFVRRMKKKA
ncbi:MAG TPA: hypothetical protein ENN43_04850 [bacterium]|nr:hypothetical protein [bacterium]